MVANLIEVFVSPTERREFAKQSTDRDLPSRLTIYRNRAKFVSTGSVEDN